MKITAKHLVLMIKTCSQSLNLDSSFAMEDTMLEEVQDFKIKLWELAPTAPLIMTVHDKLKAKFGEHSSV